MTSPAVPVLKKEITAHRRDWENLTDQINQKTGAKRSIEQELEILSRQQNKAWWSMKNAERALEVLT